MSDPINKDKETGNLIKRTNGDDGEKSKSQINADYFRALEKWLNDMRMYRSSCDLFVSNLYSSMYYNQYAKLQSPTQTRSNNIAPPVPPFNNGFSLYNVFNMGGQDPNEELHLTQQNGDGALEFIIPPLWKRFVAEMFDFFLLFLMKLAVTYIAVDFFDFVNLNRYEAMMPETDGMDYALIIELTSEILILELLHRIIVCTYEALFLHKAMQNGIGGATPGKSFMGLRVIYCTSIQQSERPNVVRVIPATDIGLAWSFARACLKNLVLALLIPICFPFFFNKFNRSSYDILCHTLVVEERRPRNRNRRRR